MAATFQKIKKIAHRSISILNGIVGDKLQDTALGIDMNFYHNYKPLALDTPVLAQYAPNKTALSPKICLFIHGLVDNEVTWACEEEDNYGALLSQDFGYTPFYVRYNSGLHISENGEALAALVEQLYENYPVEIQDICIIAHSMGGLVTHSACHFAQAQGYEWSKKITHIFLLATPHLGSYLERFANVTTNILEKVPNWHTRLVGKVLNLRSAGIKDLRYGYLTKTDWEHQDPDRLLLNNKTPIPKLPNNVSYYVISARLTYSEKHLISQLFGDVLVNAKSATARSKNIAEFNFPEENHSIFPNTSHFGLTASKDVYTQISSWLKQGVENIE